MHYYQYAVLRPVYVELQVVGTCVACPAKGSLSKFRSPVYGSAVGYDGVVRHIVLHLPASGRILQSASGHQGGQQHGINQSLPHGFVSFGVCSVLFYLPVFGVEFHLRVSDIVTLHYQRTLLLPV